MNILPLYNIGYNRNTVNNNSSFGMQSSSFGLKMAKPIATDTVSFGASATAKRAGKYGDMISQDLAIKIINKMKKPHHKLEVLLNNEFNKLINNGSVSLINRLKGEYSLRLKTGSRKLNDEQSIIKGGITDISGFCFILEDRAAFKNVMNIFNKLIKSNKITIAKTGEIKEGLPVEYHVIPPVYNKKGEIVETYNSLDPMELQKFKNMLIDKYHPASRMSDTIDSISGYSGLHVIVKNSDGTYSEIKFLTRAMADVQKVENLLYKIRNGKTVDPKYSYMEAILAPFKPVNDFASEKEKKESEKLNKAISKYTLEVYKYALKHPYEKNIKMPMPSDPLIVQYDFNKLLKLMEACESL